MKTLIFLFIQMALLWTPGDALPREDATTTQAIFIWHLEAVTVESLETLKDEGFNTLYLYLEAGDYKAFLRVLNQAQALDLEVYALNGSYDWLDHPEQMQDFLDSITLVTMENQTALKGVVLDIEPYVLTGRDTKRDYALYLKLLEGCRRETARQDLALNVVVPFWYDEIILQGEQGADSLLTRVMTLADETTVMAYRKQISGPNGIYALIHQELLINPYLQRKLIIAVETRASREGEHVSFAGMAKADVKKTFSTLKQLALFRLSPTGFAVHDFEGWQALKSAP